jgi:uncharacterized membrane protein SpoIIM required for sporulation
LYFRIRRRIIYLAFGIIAFLIAYSAGAAVHINKQQADDLRQHFAEQIKGIDQIGIFVNNARIALGMFLPAAGIGIGGFVGFNTGMIFTAIAEHSALDNVPPLLILITPFGIMEVFAYGIAISRSGLFIYQLIKKRPWREFTIPTLVEVGIVILILFIGAIIEWQIITQFGGTHSVPNI